MPASCAFPQHGSRYAVSLAELIGGTVTGRTKKERALAEQAKATAFREGGHAFKAGKDRGSNPHATGKLEEFQAWDRGWASEKSLREMNSREKVMA